MSTPVFGDGSGYANTQWTDEFQRLGHPGKFHETLTQAGATDVYYTGSVNYGVGGFIRVGTATGTLYLSGGGSLAIGDLTAGEMYEFSVSRVNLTSGTVYLLKRNHTVR